MYRFPAVPVQFATPLLTNVRPFNDNVPLKLIATGVPFAVVVAFGAPVTHEPPLNPVHCVPPDHVNNPAIVKDPPPASVPPDWVIAPVTLLVSERMSVPELRVILFVKVEVPVMVTVPPEKLTVPPPLKGPLRAYVPDWNPNVSPGFTAHDPPQVLPQVPPPPKFSVPLVTCTLPVLLNATGVLTVLVTVPPVFSNRPPLLNTCPVPPRFVISLSFPKFHVEFSGLLI
jgi:hypothetical protein